MNLTLNIPQKLKITNTSDIALMFRPYRENFDVSVPSGTTFEFTCTTAGQCLYYFKQAFTLVDKQVGLVVEKIDNYDVESDTIIVLPYHALVTISNTTTRIIGFIPYREHFEYSLAPNNSVTLEAKTLGQILYYLAQGSANGLSVTYNEDTTN